MKLILFHKVLIISAIVFFVGYGAYELYRYAIPSEPAPSGPPSPLNDLASGPTPATGPIEGLLTGIAMLLAAILLSSYLWWLWRRTSSRSTPAP